MSNQLVDDGAVIGYKPNLEYIKDQNGQETGTGDNKAVNTSGKVTYSNTLSGLVNNLPSTAISDVNYVIDNIKTLIDGLAAKFGQGNWGEYNNISTLLNAVAVNDNIYIDEFIAAHKHNIGGSIIPEIIGHLYSTEERLKILNSVLKELYYGTRDITQEEMEAKDAACIAKMKALEEAGDSHKINYVSISYDSMLNRAVSTEVFGINRDSIRMSRVVDSAQYLTDDSENVDLIIQLYQDVNEDLDYRQEAYGVQQTVEIMERTLYNYYNRRNSYLSLYNIYDGQEDFSMTHRLYEYQYRLRRSLENVIRSLASNQYYLYQITTLEQEKNNLMTNYSNINYKS